jgi:hypothetical protein
MLEPDMRVATMDHFITATEAIVTTADVEAAVIAGRPGYGVNSSAVLGNEDRRTFTADALPIGRAASTSS